jgi:hypothetical protein
VRSFPAVEPSDEHCASICTEYLDVHRPVSDLTVIFAIAQVPPVKAWLAVAGSVTFQWPGLNVTDPSGHPVAAQIFKLDPPQGHRHPAPTLRK